MAPQPHNLLEGIGVTGLERSARHEQMMHRMRQRCKQLEMEQRIVVKLIRGLEQCAHGAEMIRTSTTGACTAEMAQGVVEHQLRLGHGACHHGTGLHGGKLVLKERRREIRLCPAQLVLELRAFEKRNVACNAERIGAHVAVLQRHVLRKHLLGLAPKAVLLRKKIAVALALRLQLLLQAADGLAELCDCGVAFIHNEPVAGDLGLQICNLEPLLVNHAIQLLNRFRGDVLHLAIRLVDLLEICNHLFALGDLAAQLEILLCQRLHHICKPLRLFHGLLHLSDLALRLIHLGLGPPLRLVCRIAQLGQGLHQLSILRSQRIELGRR
eukprot:comp20031_c0_seq1/m.39253 comp20031_c0_seq1/g.39253  ORF comp20031_c0_seq1/g.39253 comp20031_c0_seq1/m.39253 type:complete len:326 (+) comp20031_c0_seq1:442-1419(+)